MSKCRTLKRSSQTLGWYQPNHFLIVLGSATPFLLIDANDNVYSNQRKYLAVYLHEYWHYLQNVTTIAGFLTFLHSQIQISLFGKTIELNANGKVRSKGSVALSPDELIRLLSVLDLDYALQGEIEPQSKFPNKTVDGWIIKNLTKKERKIDWGQKQITRHHLELDVSIQYSDSTSDPSARISIGSAAIEESLAYLTERQLAQKDTSLHLENSPQFPYTVLEHLFDFLVGIKDEPLYLISALGTLSLMTNDPAAALFEILTFYKDLRGRRLHPMSALNVILSKFGPIIHREIDSVLAEHLPSLQTMHAGRGLLENGTNTLVSIFKAAFNLRKEYILFDLDFAVHSTVARAVQSINELIHSILPCDVLQERSGSEHEVMRDFLGTSQLTAGKNGLSVSDGMRALQSQQHFMIQHLASSGFLPTKQAFASPDSRCPYYTACDARYRMQSPKICDQAPWENYTTGPSEACWYGFGVGAHAGLIQVGRKSS